MRIRHPGLASVLSGLLLAAVLAGCAPAPGTGAWPPPAAGDTTITILTGSDTSLSAGNNPVTKGEPGMYKQLADWWNKYEAAKQHIRIRLDTVAGVATTVHGEMLAASNAGRTSYDVYNLDSEWVPEFAAEGYIRSLQGKVPVRGFLAKPLASGRDTAGRLYALPFTTDVGLLYYRTDLVRPARVARLHTFNQVTALGQDAIERHPRAGLTEPYAGQFGSYEGLTVNVLEIIRGYDPAAFTAVGTAADSNAVSGGLQQLADAFTAGEIPHQELSYSEAQALSSFATGRAVFMRNWPIYYEQILAASQGGTGTVARNFGVAALPFPSVLGGQDLAVSARSPHPAEALKVIQFLTSAAAERCLFAVGGFPATRGSAYQGSSWLPAGYGAAPRNPLCGTQAGQETKIRQTILAAIGTAIPRPVTRYYTEFSTVIQDQVWPMLSRASRSDNPGVPGVVDVLATALQATATGHAPPAGG
jgi:multiple sugar transport system substrate-binding protein